MGTPGPKGRGFSSRGEVSKCCSFCGTLRVSRSLFLPLSLLPFPGWFLDQFLEAQSLLELNRW